MTPRPTVLVTAVSRHGSTSDVADRLADVLREELDATPWSVERREPDQVRDVEEFDAIVIGSAVYMGRWTGQAKRLVRRLDGHTFTGVWLFSTGPVDPAEPKPELARSVLTDHPDIVDHVIFGGCLDVDRLSVPERVLVRALKVPSGDYRSWPAIEGWASEIASRLALVSAADSR